MDSTLLGQGLIFNFDDEDNKNLKNKDDDFSIIRHILPPPLLSLRRKLQQHSKIEFYLISNHNPIWAVSGSPSGVHTLV